MKLFPMSIFSFPLDGKQRIKIDDFSNESKKGEQKEREKIVMYES